jgi:hypothetical protein
VDADADPGGACSARLRLRLGHPLVKQRRGSQRCGIRPRGPSTPKSAPSSPVNWLAMPPPLDGNAD